MKNTTKIIALLTFTLALSGCRYSNTFTGTYNSEPAKLEAFSKNTDKYCIALQLVSSTSTKSNFISAQAVFNPNDIFASKSFNTKGASCSANMTEYLVGTRTSKLLGTSLVAQSETAGINLCRVVYYNSYQYQDSIQFEIRDNATDALSGTFSGTGLADTYTDTSRPASYGPVYYCGPIYPRPRPGQPFPYPGPVPFPHPHRF